MFNRMAAILAFFLLTRQASALIYLSENSLESILHKCDSIAIGAVTDFSAKDNRATVKIEETLKGNAKGDFVLSGVMIRVDSKTTKPAMAAGDRVVLFIMGENADRGRLLHCQKLENDAEVKTMKGVIAEITPVAQTLNDLANPAVDVDQPALKKILSDLVASKNAYTQIIVGRLMSTSLASRVKPEGWEDILTTALTSKRMELQKGSLDWSAKYEKLPEAVRAAIAKLAASAEDEKIKSLAADLLKK